MYIGRYEGPISHGQSTTTLAWTKFQMTVGQKKNLFINSKIPLSGLEYDIDTSCLKNKSIAIKYQESMPSHWRLRMVLGLTLKRV